MPKCSVCNKEEAPCYCHKCGNDFCREHKNHGCGGLLQTTVSANNQHFQSRSHSVIKGLYDPTKVILEYFQLTSDENREKAWGKLEAQNKILYDWDGTQRVNDRVRVMTSGRCHTRDVNQEHVKILLKQIENGYKEKIKIDIKDIDNTFVQEHLNGTISHIDVKREIERSENILFDRGKRVDDEIRTSSKSISLDKT